MSPRETSEKRPPTPAGLTCRACGRPMFLMRIFPIMNTRPLKVTRTYECNACQAQVTIEGD